MISGRRKATTAMHAAKVLAYRTISRSSSPAGQAAQKAFLCCCGPSRKSTRRIRTSACWLSSAARRPSEKACRKRRLPDYVYCADTVVVPSLSEGFGFAAAEACAMRRPVIVTDNASLPEVVSGKVLTVPPNHVDALAYAMERALQDDFQIIPEKRFLVSANLEKHIALYNSILTHP